MGYFPNSTAWEFWASDNCFKCAHWPKDDSAPPCPVEAAHMLYSYELCNEEKHPGKIILDMLIPETKDGLGCEQCAMFKRRDGLTEKHLRDWEKYKAIMAEAGAPNPLSTTTSGSREIEMMNAIADAFLHGPIKRRSLAPNGICEMAVEFKGHTIEVSWYSEGNPAKGRRRMVRLDQEGLPVSGRQADEIVCAAQDRAATEANKILAELLS